MVVATCGLSLLSLLISASCGEREAPAHPPARASLARLVYSLLPLASISRGWGWLAATHFPQPIQWIILWVFSVATGCDRYHIAVHLTLTGADCLTQV